MLERKTGIDLECILIKLSCSSEKPVVAITVGIELEFAYSNILIDAFGIENLPKEGGYMMYPNHQGKYDVYGIFCVHKKPLFMTYVYDDYFIFEDDTTHDLYNTIFSSALHLYPRDSSGINGNCYEQFGYTIKDLNQDGIDELILRLNNHVVIAIFTMVNNQPVLLDYYWNRKNYSRDSTPNPTVLLS